jgi:hypothetical protein
VRQGDDLKASRTARDRRRFVEMDVATARSFHEWSVALVSNQIRKAAPGRLASVANEKP